ncbi:membrane protein insertase YidC, partial [Jatrophihabitans endophyticus]|uniref:membrane protein insertase YidC n=1 Tax=Jatrophihabitans endophyticus TaxID=1206085 RepID=UPI0019EB0490
MALQQEEGFNPLSGCLPMFLQFPVFIGLYHSLRHISNSNSLCSNPAKHQHLLTQYTFSATETCDAARARIFGAPLAASFHDTGTVIRQLGGDPSSTRILLVILLIISAGATFGTQLLVRANQTTVAEGTSATVQRAMLYLIPLGTLVSGLLFRFPLGVLLYWFTSNLWTLGQQAYIIKFHPPTEEPAAAPTGALGRSLAPRPGQRPVRMDKSAGSRSAPSASTGSASTGGDADASSTHERDTASSSNSAARTSVPRPGQRPNRPSGKRPPAKRPTQAKKRR